MGSMTQNGDRKLEIKQIAGSLGEIHEVDLRSLGDSTIKQIRQTLLDHKVTFFRNQELLPDEFLKFSARFGKRVKYPFVKGIDCYHPSSEA